MTTLTVPKIGDHRYVAGPLRMPQGGPDCVDNVWVEFFYGIIRSLYSHSLQGMKIDCLSLPCTSPYGVKGSSENSVLGSFAMQLNIALTDGKKKVASNCVFL